VEVEAQGVERRRCRDNHRRVAPFAGQALQLLAEVRGSKLAEAVAYLDDALADGPRPVQEVKAEAEESGITEQTLIRAKQKLGIDSIKLDFGGGWAWQSPEKADDAAETRSSS
jgi:hypothetical protein